MSRPIVKKSLGRGGSGIPVMGSIITGIVKTMHTMLNASATPVADEALGASLPAGLGFTFANDNVVEGSESFKESRPEITTVQITAKATASGNITITLDGTGVNIAVLDTDDTPAKIATKVVAGVFAGWTQKLATGTTDTVIFTSTTNGAKAGAMSFSGAATGVTATVTNTQDGLSAAAVSAADIAGIEYAYANDVPVAKVYFKTAKFAPTASYSHVASMPADLPTLEE